MHVGGAGVFFFLYITIIPYMRVDICGAVFNTHFVLIACQVVFSNI